MVSDGDTITYTYSDGSVISEDVSNVNEMTIDYLDGAGGSGGTQTSDSEGGRVENVVVDVGNYDTIYIWVGGGTDGRYSGASPASSGGSGGGSTEVSYSNTDGSDSSGEPFIVGAGGGGGGGYTNTMTYAEYTGGGGARGGVGSNDGAGVSPPAGGDAGTNGSTPGDPGEGAVASIPKINDPGTTYVGNGGTGDGEVQISYALTAPPAPTNIQITDSQTEDKLTLDWDEVDGAAGYYIYRSESSFSDFANATKVADVTSPPYTDSGLEDGEKFYYRVSSHD